MGVVGASSTIGIVIPPSLSLVLYGLIAEQSVPRLFLAGILPGLLQAAMFFWLGRSTTRTNTSCRVEPSRAAYRSWSPMSLNALCPHLAVRRSS